MGKGVSGNFALVMGVVGDGDLLTESMVGKWWEG